MGVEAFGEAKRKVSGVCMWERESFYGFILQSLIMCMRKKGAREIYREEVSESGRERGRERERG